MSYLKCTEKIKIILDDGFKQVIPLAKKGCKYFYYMKEIMGKKLKRKNGSFNRKFNLKILHPFVNS